MAVLRRGNPNSDYEKLLEAAKRARLPYDRDTWLNLAFFLDEQYVEWATEAFTVRRIPRPEAAPNMPRPVQNKIMHFVETEHAQALQNRPQPDVLPPTDDPQDISDSNVALAYLKWVMDPQNADFDAELADATHWALVGGEGYLKWTWNAKEERGDVCSVSPLDVYGDPYAKRFRNSRYVIHSQFMDVEQIYDIYGIEVNPSDVSRQDATKTALLREMGQAPVLHGAVVNELWMKSSRRHPNGMFVVWTKNTQLVEPTKFPYEHGHIPITQIGAIPVPGAPHCMSAVKYLRNPQMELNKFHAQSISIRENFANPKWWIDTALELEHDPDNSPNQILRGNSNGGQLEPKLITPDIGAINQAQDGAFIASEMMDTVGLHEVSNAQVPGRVESSKAIELLKEADTSRLAELSRSTASAIAEGGWQSLELARQYGGDEMLVQTYSRLGLPEVKRFKSGALKPGYRVRVTMGTGLARSRAAREDQVMNLVQNGILKDPEQIAELLDVPVGVVDTDMAIDIRAARNENYIMADNKVVKASSWDNHQIHIREHNNFRKSAEYKLLPVRAQQIIEFDVEQHDQMNTQQMQQALQNQAAAQAALNPSGGSQPAPQSPPAQPEPGEGASS